MGIKLSQVEARALEKQTRNQEILKILFAIGRWIFPVIAIVLLGLAVWSYLGGRGEDNVATVNEAIAESEALLADRQAELEQTWVLSLQAATGVSYEDLEVVDLSQETVTEFAARQEPVLEPGYELVGYQPILRSVLDGKLSYVVILEWESSGVEQLSPQSGDAPTKELFPYNPSQGIIYGEEKEVGSNRFSVVWFSIDSGTGNQKIVGDLSGGWVITPLESRVK